MIWRRLQAAIADENAQGIGPVTLAARTPFYDEDALPFRLFGSQVLRIEPGAGFQKEALAAGPDEAAVIVPCPDAPGWLVPESIVADWMRRHVRHDVLEDILLSHPLYAYRTEVDDVGHSRGPGPLVSWIPGVPTVAVLDAPEFLPDDREAPRDHRDRALYAAGVVDLLDVLQRSFDLEDVTVPVRQAVALL